MAKLRIVDGPLSGTEFVLENQAVAGRHIECAIPVPDPKVSRNHAEFIPNREGQFTILDLGSSNGTAVNGVSLVPGTPRLLFGGDEIRMGQNTFRYFTGDARLADIDIPGYVLNDILAEGGMGSIFSATHRETGRPAAVKILRPGYAQDEEFVARFIQEARAAGRLSHPNIIKVYNVGRTVNGSYYFTMELVKGATLSQRLGILSDREAAWLFMSIADALECAHRRGIIHRDIKPDNILIGLDGEPKLTDLGIAVMDNPNLPQSGPHVLGTPHYMSPEQASGRNITAATDIYSLGATFYHVFFGQPLFDAPTPEQIMTKHVCEPPRPLAQVAPQLPRQLAAVVDRCLEKVPEMRYPSAGALHHAISEAIRSAYPDLVVPPARPCHWSRSWRKPALAAALVILAALTAYLLGWV